MTGIHKSIYCFWLWILVLEIISGSETAGRLCLFSQQVRVYGRDKGETIENFNNMWKQNYFIDVEDDTLWCSRGGGNYQNVMLIVTDKSIHLIL